MTRDQLGACIALDQSGDRRQVPLEWIDTFPPGAEQPSIQAADLPIPGLCLFVDRRQTVLEVVQPDGTVIDLMAVFRAAEDVCRNWHKGGNPKIPQFVGDFGRLTKLAEAINGRRVDAQHLP